VNISVEAINDTRKSVTVNIPVDVIDQEEKSLVADFVKQARIPGFRAGKAPLNIIKQRFKKQIGEELNRKITSKAYKTAIEEAKLNIFSVIDVDGGEFATGQAGEMKFTFDVNPDFELPNYTGIEVTIPNAEPTAEEIEEAKDYFLNQRAEYKEIDTPAEKGDYVKLSYEGKVGDTSIVDWVPDDPVYGKQATTWEEAGAEGAPGVPAIVQGIVGMKKGDSADLEETFADDFRIEALQGKTVTYHVDVLDVRKKMLPEINEEFLKNMQVDTEEEWLKRIKDDVRSQKEQQLEQDKRQQILDKIGAQVDIPVPESAIDVERDHLLRDYMSRAIRQGITEGQLEQDKESIHASAVEAAQNRVKLQIILGEIAKKESITVENEDMSPRIMQEAMMNRIKPEQVVKELQNDREKLMQMQREVLFNKTLAFLVDQANVTEQ